LQGIVSSLKQKNDSAEFVTVFVETYGYPFWKDAVAFPKGDYFTYAVPVRSRNSTSEIEAIWFFSVGSGRTNYHIYTRDMAGAMTRSVGGNGIEDTWMFDYFTRYALYKEPASHLNFLHFNKMTTRSLVAISTCGDIYYWEEDGIVIEHQCWTEYTVIGGGGGNGGSTNLNGSWGSFDSDPPPPCPGGGAGGSTPSQDSKTKTDAEKQVNDSLRKNCGFAATLDAIGGLSKLVDIEKKDGVTGGYNPITKEILIYSNWDGDVRLPAFLEELVHFMQDQTYKGGTAQYLDSGKTNIEFEAKVLTDLYRYAKEGKLWNHAEAGVRYKITTENISKYEYETFLESIRNDGMTNESYFNMLDKFNKYTLSKGDTGKIDRNLKPQLLNAYGKKFLSNDCK